MGVGIRIVKQMGYIVERASRRSLELNNWSTRSASMRIDRFSIWSTNISEKVRLRAEETNHLRLVDPHNDGFLHGRYG
jgi:hypothetical protein